MAATLRRGDAPPRSPERQALADAIEAHRAANDAVTAVGEAQTRLRTDLSEARSALSKAREAFQSAKADAPRVLVDHLIGDDGRPQLVDGFPRPAAEAQLVLDDAERRVAQYREAMKLLNEEMTARERDLADASRELDAAVAAVVSSDPRKQELVDAFFRTGKQTLALAAALRTVRHIVTGVNDDDIGLALRLHEIARAGSDGHHSAFTPNAAFALALADLAEDPDAQLPELPICE